MHSFAMEKKKELRCKTKLFYLKCFHLLIANAGNPAILCRYPMRNKSKQGENNGSSKMAELSSQDTGLASELAFSKLAMCTGLSSELAFSRLAMYVM